MTNMPLSNYIVALSIFVTACGSGFSGPSEDQISAVVKKQTPSGLNIDSMRFEIFPAEDKGQGRISVAGKFIATEDRVRDMSQGRTKLAAEIMRSLGATKEQSFRYINKLRPGKFNLYEKIASIGDIFDFSGELHYLETVNGFDIRGQIKSDIPGDATSSLPLNSLVYGSPEYKIFFENFATLHKDETEKLPNLARELFSNLADGAKIMDGETALGTIDPFDLKLESWAIGSVNYGKTEVYTSLIPINIKAASNFTINWVNLKKGDNKQFKIQLRIYTSGPNPKRACLNLDSTGSTGELCWNGTLWKWDGTQYLLNNGIEESRSKRPLTIKP